MHTPSLTGCAERAISWPDISIDTFGRDVANLLRYEDLRDVTLVATSCGGMAVARAAELEPDRVGRLILVDALIPFAGLSPAETVPEQWAPTWQAGVIPETDGIAMSQSSLDRMHAEFGPDDGRILDEYRSTFPRGPMFETADLRRFWQGGWPATVVWCQRRHNPPEAVQRRAADLLQAEWRRSTAATTRSSPTPTSWRRSSRSAACKVQYPERDSAFRGCSFRTSSTMSAPQPGAFGTWI